MTHKQKQKQVHHNLRVRLTKRELEWRKKHGIISPREAEKMSAEYDRKLALRKVKHQIRSRGRRSKNIH